MIASGLDVLRDRGYGCGYMYMRTAEEATDPARFFLEPRNSTHRQYEALRAYFVEKLDSHVVAARYGYEAGAFRTLCYEFRKDPSRDFFLPPQKGPKVAPKMDRARELAVTLRKQEMSIYDISAALRDAGTPLSPAAVGTILKQEGFAKLPRRRDEERVVTARPTAAEVADVRELNLSSQRFHTKFGGLFLFLPYLASMPFDSLMEQAKLPGSKMVPAGQAMRSLLALKLWGTARKSHVMSQVFDQGLALFAGLNVTPKREFLTAYSCRIEPASYRTLMERWSGAMVDLGLEHGNSFDLDFHTIPFHGEDALIEKHYVAKRSRKQKGILAFVAQDADQRVFCYATTQIRKDEQNDEIIRFVKYWKERTGAYPKEVVFDSKVTTHDNLNRLNKFGIAFITLRKRGPKLMEEIRAVPESAWKRIELENVTRKYRTPKILDAKIELEGYDGQLRQVVVDDLGHEEPTLVLTNQLKRSASSLMTRYAQRMIIENGISDAIDFFHMDALSSVVPMKTDCDIKLTLMASSLYRLFGTQIGNGYKTARSQHIFQDFIDATATVTVDQDEVVVRYQKRAHNPLLLAAGFGDTNVPIPWLGGRRLRFHLG